jgi:U6 snRNA-associated Sm-like protein LSm5
MKNDKEFVGTLRGFDDYVNIVLDDVTAIELDGTTGQQKKYKLDSILLNGNNVAILVPGSSPEYAAAGGIGPAGAGAGSA